jgi:hypothetical protein
MRKVFCFSSHQKRYVFAPLSAFAEGDERIRPRFGEVRTARQLTWSGNFGERLGKGAPRHAGASPFATALTCYHDRHPPPR